MPASRGRHSLSAALRTLVACTWATARANEYVPQNITNPPGYRLLPGVTQVPAPIAVAPDEQNWAGIDGAWNTFSVRVGSQQSNSSVLVSTAAKQVWLIDAHACAATAGGCDDSRGRSFNSSESTTYQELGDYDMDVGGSIGLSVTGRHGVDTVRLGGDGLTLNRTAIGTIGSNAMLSTTDFWLGFIGLQSQATGFLPQAARRSFITELFETMYIPSQSFGYTAGARYRTGQTTALASLTLGGYDASRFNDTRVNFALDSEQKPVVGLVGLLSQSESALGFDLFRATTNNVAMIIDSTVAEIWLPLEICKAFEEAFGLIYDEATNLYLVDSILHSRLLGQNPNITFMITNTKSTDVVQSVQITLPYAAFDLEAQPPYQSLSETSRYFPIRQGANASQWILGRTFLQEAYLQVDWERSQFSVHPRTWADQPSDFRAIVSPRYGRAFNDAPISSGPEYAPLSTAWIVGITFGVVIVCMIAGALIWWFFWRRRQQGKRGLFSAASVGGPVQPNKPDETAANLKDERDDSIHPNAELPERPYLWGGRNPFADPKPPQEQIYEMMGDIPVSEADSRQLSDKESMVVRERNINGVDMYGRPDRPTLASPTRLGPGSALNEVSMTRQISSNHRASFSTGASTQEAFQLPPYPTHEQELDVPDISRRRFSYES